jgi:uncharacterized protein YeaO (DUF488 family)
LIVQTARIGMGGRDELDVTAKNVTTATRPFAPHGHLVAQFVKRRREFDRERKNARYLPDVERQRKLTWLEGKEADMFEAYRRRYLAQLRGSYKRDRKPWDRLLARRRVVFTCFCTNHERCHRTILAECFQLLGAENRGEIHTNQQELPWT